LAPLRHACPIDVALSCALMTRRVSAQSSLLSAILGEMRVLKGQRALRSGV
jgi:hypothetical protein